MAEPLVRYMLFVDETPLPGVIHGSSSYAADFSRCGPRDREGRSLRQLDLKTRLFRYPFSYLIHFDAFAALPAPVRDVVMRWLWEVLTGRDESPDFARLSTRERREVLGILTETLPGLPEYWKPSRTATAEL